MYDTEQRKAFVKGAATIINVLIQLVGGAVLIGLGSNFYIGFGAMLLVMFLKGGK